MLGMKGGIDRDGNGLGTGGFCCGVGSGVNDSGVRGDPRESVDGERNRWLGVLE